jgi:ornithine cyclodeaminase/alanine dehydrogenase-like protein (mu-crystallin family)
LTPNALTSAPIRDALSGADIVVTLSDAAEGLFAASDLAPDALLCAMGGRYEFDSDVLAAAQTFVVDELDFVCNVGTGSYWIRSGQVTRDHLAHRLDGTVGEILAGKAQIAPGGRTLAIVQGMAICDLAIAKTILDRAASS